MTTGLALFDTDIGRCGVAWGGRGLLGVQLPEATDARTLSRLAQKAPGAREVAMPDHIRQACNAMIELLRGEAKDLAFIAVDMEQVPAFNRSVYDIARTIAPGETLTYGDIAVRLGDKFLSRRRRQGARRKSFSHRDSMSPGASGQRKDRRLLGQWRRRHQIPDARHRARPDPEPCVRGRTDAVRSRPVDRAATAPVDFDHCRSICCQCTSLQTR